ncbi:cation transport protein ChaC [Chloropicon primus]|nr:cation transport protein ChaC [Chloropicon primus]
MWVFGYGSLIWRPSFRYERSRIAYAKGFKRVWYQGSTDHRGTPERPGRTVTLHEEAGAVVWGRAFEVRDEDWEDGGIYAYLKEREKQYDLEARLPLFQVCEETGEERVAVEEALTWIATPDRALNPNYLGPLPLEQLAKQIAISSGPSGPNSEYLFMLADAMREHGLGDAELFQLEEEVRAQLEDGAGS